MLRPVNLIFILFLLTSSQSYAQLQGPARVDSLKEVLQQLNQKSPSRDVEVDKINSLNELAYEIYRNNPDSTILLGKTTLSMSRSISYLNGVAYANYLIGLGNGYLNNNDTAQLYFYKGLAIAEKTNNKKIIGQTYNSLGNISRNKGNLKEADSLFLLSLHLWEELKDERGIALVNMGLGTIYHQSGNAEKALEYYFKALAMSEKIKDNKSIARCLSNIGKVYSNTGNYPEALSYMFKSLEISEAVSDKKGIAICYGNIGTVNEQTGAYSEALKYRNKSLKMETELGNKTGMAESLISIGHIYSLMQNDSMAMVNYLEALKNYQSIDNKIGVADVSNRLGDVCMKKSQPGLAISFYKQSIYVRELTNDQLGLTESYNNLAQSYLLLNQPLEAKKVALLSISIAKETNSKPELKNAYLVLSRCDSVLKDWKNAYDHLKTSFLIKDTIFNEESAKRVAEVQEKYESEKKEKEILLLQNEKEFQEKEIARQKTIFKYSIAASAIIALSLLLSFYFFKRKRDAEHRQKETSLRLEVSETEMKALRSQMNPHFIFNALQSIQSFLIKNRSEEANIYLLKFSKLMRAVLENSRFHEISLKKDMEALELYMQLESIRLTYPFTYQFHIDPDVDVEETTIPPLILQPFVENAIWHGLLYKPEPGHINISITTKENSLFVTVEDNGVGRNKNSQSAQPSVKKESLGMKLTEERLKILNEFKKMQARFQITDLFSGDQHAAGTKVELYLPMQS